MVNDASGHWIGFGVGDIDPPTAKPTDQNYRAVSLINEKLYDRFQSTHAFGQVREQAIFDDVTAASVALIAANYGLTIPHDTNGKPVANLAFRTKIGAYPPPKPPTHAAFTVRGTGGIIGQDYTSIIAQALPGIYHEHPIDYAAGMGGLPVGAPAPNNASGNECAEQARQMLTDAVLGSTVSFSVFGYSLGTKGVVMFLNDLFDPSNQLYAHRNRLVCVVLVADPWRPFGKSFFMGPIQAGQGIGTPYFTMSQAAQDALGYRCCWLVNPADLYTDAPLGATGQVLADVEEIILNTSVSDPMGTMSKAVQMLMQIVLKDGGLTSLIPSGITGLGGLGGLLAGLAGGGILPTIGMAGMLLPVLEGGLTGAIGGITGNGQNLPPGPAADLQAAILALKFFGSGTAPHISYHDTPWSSNGPQTFLELGIQHAADWGSRTQVLT